MAPNTGTFIPIAWYDAWRGEWVVPNVRYSASAGRHQAYVRSALPRHSWDVCASWRFWPV